MGYRVTNEDELKRLAKGGMVSQKDFESASTALRGIAKPNVAKQTRKKHEPSARGYAESKLYNLLFPFYKDYWKGGELIRELRAIKNRDLRIDVALPNYKIAIEVDGIEGHAMHESGHLNLDGFKRDREKSLMLTALGWQVITCVTSFIDKKPGLILDAVECAVKARTYQKIKIKHPANRVTPHVVF